MVVGVIWGARCPPPLRQPAAGTPLRPATAPPRGRQRLRERTRGGGGSGRDGAALGARDDPGSARSTGGGPGPLGEAREREAAVTAAAAAARLPSPPPHLLLPLLLPRGGHDELHLGAAEEGLGGGLGQAPVQVHSAELPGRRRPGRALPRRRGAQQAAQERARPPARQARERARDPPQVGPGRAAPPQAPQRPAAPSPLSPLPFPSSLSSPLLLLPAGRPRSSPPSPGARRGWRAPAAAPGPGPGRGGAGIRCGRAQVWAGWGGGGRGCRAGSGGLPVACPPAPPRACSGAGVSCSILGCPAVPLTATARLGCWASWGVVWWQRGSGGAAAGRGGGHVPISFPIRVFVTCQSRLGLGRNARLFRLSEESRRVFCFSVTFCCYSWQLSFRFCFFYCHVFLLFSVSSSFQTYLQSHILIFYLTCLVCCQKVYWWLSCAWVTIGYVSKRLICAFCLVNCTNCSIIYKSTCSFLSLEHLWIGILTYCSNHVALFLSVGNIVSPFICSPSIHWGSCDSFTELIPSTHFYLQSWDQRFAVPEYEFLHRDSSLFLFLKKEKR